MSEESKLIFFHANVKTEKLIFDILWEAEEVMT
jgi:hypothetical protein